MKMKWSAARSTSKQAGYDFTRLEKVARKDAHRGCLTSPFDVAVFLHAKRPE
jgi:hypothetical protein